MTIEIRDTQGRRLKDHTGERYGKLVVVGYSHYDKRHYWECRCDCGNTTVMLVRKKRNNQSCGCARYQYHKDKRLPDNKAVINRILNGWKKAAIKRGYTWELTDEEAITLTKHDCFYCNQPPSNAARIYGTSSVFNYSGIDRIDNRLGYLSENVVSCCKRCNVAKSTMSLSEFADWIERLSGVYPQRFAPMIAILKLYDDE